MFAGRLKASVSEGKRDIGNELCPVGREALSSKEAKIKAPKERVSQLEAMVDPGAIPLMVSSSLATTVGSGVAAGTHEAHRRRGKAPRVSKFTGEDPEYIVNCRHWNVQASGILGRRRRG